MTHIEVQGSSSTQEVDITTDPEFQTNRAMVQRAVRMIGDASLPQHVRDVAKSDAVHYAMKNIRQFDPHHEGQKLLEEGDEPLLLEAATPDEDTKTPEYIRTILAEIEAGKTHEPVLAAKS